MKSLEIRILFKSGIEKEYYIKSENVDFENVKGLKDYMTNAIRHEAVGTIELIDLKTGFETLVNVSDITAMQFGKIQNM